MSVRRQLGDVKSVRCFPAEFAQDDSVANVDWHAALQVGKSEIDSPVTAIGRSQDREQCLVLVDGQQLSVAECPSLWREVPADDFDLA